MTGQDPVAFQKAVMKEYPDNCWAFTDENRICIQLKPCLDHGEETGLQHAIRNSLSAEEWMRLVEGFHLAILHSSWEDRPGFEQLAKKLGLHRGRD